MATEEVTPPEGFEAFEAVGNDDDEPTFELEPGDTLQGVVLDLVDGKKEGRPWYRLRIKDEERGVGQYFARDKVKTAAREGRIQVGEEIWIGMLTVEESFKNDDGEKVTYNPTSVGFPGGD